MLVTPVTNPYQPVAKTRPKSEVSWANMTQRVANTKANDNPALEITRQVPAQQFKGQFIDLLS